MPKLTTYLLTAILFFGCFGCESRENSFYVKGRNAQRAGVPAMANPYLHWPERADSWLQGWIDGSKEK